MTRKRRSSLSDAQMAFTFDTPVPARGVADLAGLERMVSAAVARALKEDSRSREEIAGAMSALLADDVTRWMLDSYASEARDLHRISAGRLLALIAATERFDILDTLVSRVGGRVLVGAEIQTARVGHLRTKIAELARELRSVERSAIPMDRAGAQ